MVDHRLADGGPLAEDDLENGLGQPGLGEQGDGLQRGQRGLQVRAEHDGVARHQGRERVTDREGERVVPRGDHPHHSFGMAVLDSAGGQREQAGPAPRTGSRARRA